jgi:hypothetical protein
MSFGVGLAPTIKDCNERSKYSRSFVSVNGSMLTYMR